MADTSFFNNCDDETEEIESAKQYADLSRDWAIKLDGLVDGIDFSSKYWAQQAAEGAGLSVTIKEDGTPLGDSFTVLNFGAGVSATQTTTNEVLIQSTGQVLVETFDDGVGFIAGTSDEITLATEVVSKNNIDIYFDGQYQNKETYDVSGILVTFDSVIPVGVSEIEVVYPRLMDVGVAAAENVTFDGSNVDVELVSLRARVTTNESDISSLEGRVTTAEAEITGLDGRITTAESDIVSLDGRLTIVERSTLVNRPFPNVAAVDTATFLQTGDFVEWLGYSTPGDGGGNKGEIGTGFGPADNGSVFDLSGSGLQARGLFPNGVWVDQFGAKGDATRPGISTPTEPIGGTDDTSAFNNCRAYLQDIAFQPNAFVGYWGGLALRLTENKSYKVVGDNPLGVNIPGATNLNRQSWRIEGNNAIIYWETSADDDTFIECGDIFTTQEYRNFTLYVCNAPGSRGVFFSNIANPGTNGATRMNFHRVQVYHVQPQDTANGLKRTFQFIGTNLGDRVTAYGCTFSQAHTHCYYQNGESVQHSFQGCTFASYLDNSDFFYIASGAQNLQCTDSCVFLMKGTGQTLFKTRFGAPGTIETGSNGANTYFGSSGCRLECTTGLIQTLADCDFGVCEIDGITMAAGGFPDATSPIVISRKAAVVRISNSHLRGRLVVGPEPSSYLVFRSYAIKLTNCQFSMDVGQNLYVEDSPGVYTEWRDAIVGDYLRPGIVIEGTDTRTITWQGLSSDTRNYVIDNTYPCNADYQTLPVSKKILVGDYRGSSGFAYLDTQDYVVLPPFSVITSIKVSHASIPIATYDTIRIMVGSAQLDYAIPNLDAVYGIEILQPSQIIISDDDADERTIATEIRQGGAPVASPNLIGHLEIEYRPAFGMLEIDTTEVGGVRLTRVVT